MSLILYNFRDISTCLVYVTAYDLEHSFLSVASFEAATKV